MPTSDKKDASKAIKASDLHLMTAFATIISQNKRAYMAVYVLVGVLLVMGVVIAMLMSKWEVQTRFVTINKDSVLGQSFKILPSPLPPQQKILFVRSALRNYITNRVMVDHLSEDLRFPKAFRASSPDVANAFMEEYKKGKKDFEGLRRDVEIVEDIEITPIGKVGVHQIEFITYDYVGSERKASTTKATTTWIATIRYVVMPEQVDATNALDNPIGVFVTKYVIREKKQNREVATNAN